MRSATSQGPPRHVSPPPGYRGLVRHDPTGRYVTSDTRGRSLWARFRRHVWWEIDHAWGEFLAGFPCNVLDHHWVEKPPSQTSRQGRAEGRMEFKCSRCPVVAGFSNR